MPRRKLSDEDVETIRLRRQAGESWRRIADDYGVAFTTIRNVVHRGYRGYRNQYSRAA